MTSKNDITGDPIVTKKTGDSYRDGWDRIFKKKEVVEEEVKKKSQKDKSNGTRKDTDS